MRNRLFQRIRRATVGTIAGVAAVGGLAVTGSVLVASSPASAAPTGCPTNANTPTCGQVVSSARPTMVVGQLGQTAGNLTITLVDGSTWKVGDYLQVQVQDFAGNDRVGFTNLPSVTATPPATGTTPTFGDVLDTSGDYGTLGPPALAALPGACVPNDLPESTATPTCDTITIRFTNNGTVVDSNGQSIVIGSTSGPVKYDVASNAISGPVTINVADGFAGNLPSTTSNSAVAGPPGPDFTTLGGASNAVIFQTPLSTALTAQDTPIIGMGEADQHAGDWALEVGNGPPLPIPPTTVSWQVGDQFIIRIADHNGANCTATGDTIGFNGPASAIGVVAFANSSEATAVPTFSAPTFAESTGACTTAGVDDELVLTTTNSGQIPAQAKSSGFYPITIGIINVTYNVGIKAAEGAISVALSTPGGGAPFSTVATPFGPSNAFVSPVSMTANSPAVDLYPGATDQAISPISISELSPPNVFPAIQSGWYVCVTLKATTFAQWYAQDPGTVTVTSGDATVAAPGLQGFGSRTLYFTVGTQSVADPSTYQLANLAVDTGFGYVGPVTVYVSAGPVLNQFSPDSEGCGFNVGLVAPVFQLNQLTEQTQAFAVVQTNRISGSDADATAASEFESQFPAATGAPQTTCPPNEDAVLATDLDPWDGLTGNYLAGNLQTGILLSGPGTPSPEALNALRIEGITTVYRLGGPVVWGSNFDSVLGSTQAYDCGGQVPRTNEDGSPVNIKVVDLYGTNADATAQQVGEFFGVEGVGEANYGAAYCASLPYCQGTDIFNTSGGGASSPAEPTQSVTSGSTNFNHNSPACPALYESGNCYDTAIVVTDQTWQDAISASPISYWGHFPIFTTPTASLGSAAMAGLQDDEIQQVLLFGGTVATSDALEGQLTSMGISVLRIAGPTYVGTSVEAATFELDSNGSFSPDVNGGLGTGTDFNFYPFDIVGHQLLPEGLNWGSFFSNDLVLTRGDWWSDGVAGGVVAASGGGMSQLFDGQSCTPGDDQNDGDGGVSASSALVNGDDPWNIGTTVITGDDECPAAMVLTQDPNTIGSDLDTFLQANGARWFYWHPTSNNPIFSLTFLGGTAAESQANVTAALNDIATQPQNP